jgi:serine/threonine-protein kinase
MSPDNASVGADPGMAPDRDDASDVEVARVLESYLAAVEAGEPADPQRLLHEHPDLAERLRACLRVLRVAEQAAQDVSGPPQPEDPRSDRGPVSMFPRESRFPQSSLVTLDFGTADPPQVLLRDLADDAEPVLRPRFAAMAGNSTNVGRFQLQGEIARGGMGAILKGRDVDLGRDLAIKVLLESHRNNPEVVRRFVEEAQIGGQLQHPGVVPVYELGTFPDRRPFFAMKLVRGRTLAALLGERGVTQRANPPRPSGERSPQDVGGEGPPGEDTGGGARVASDLPRFLSIFEQVCQTMAYAHALCVIHRDLKPSNVMVGSFGEVQVMDWGLAKVLASGGVADEASTQPAHETVVMTVRSGSAGSGSESQAGRVLGTPAYMAPEQARGEVERIDERADVFGLGAILCEILTGHPPFAGDTREEIRAQSARGDLGDALGRLAACGGECELVELAVSCLKPERNRRPRQAGDVARRVSGYLAGVQERLKAAEMERVDAQARAEEARVRAAVERSRRRRTVALAASVLGLVVLASGGWAYLARQRTARLMVTTRVVTEALAEAERLRGQAQSAAVGDLAKWSEAMGAVRRARDLLTQGHADDALQTRVATELANLEREQAAAQQRATEFERDRRLLGELETIRGNHSEHWDPKRTDGEFAAAFRAFGIDLDQLDPKEAGRRIVLGSAPVEMASYLDFWALERREARDKKEDASWRRLFAAAQAADPDRWRAALRDQIGRDDREALFRLAVDQRVLAAQEPATLVLLAVALRVRGARGQADGVLRRAWRLAPGDFWVNFELGGLGWRGDRYERPEEATRFCSAAVAIRPRSSKAHYNLGLALQDQGKLDEAIAEYREALRLKADPDAHINLANALRDQGRLDEATAEYHKALRLKPAHPLVHNNLGNALLDQGKLDEAIAEWRKALKLKPDYASAHTDLGIGLRQQGKLDEAIAEHREALRLKPDFAQAHNNLGNALLDQGKLDEAIVAFREAIRLKPDYAVARSTLGVALAYQGKLEEAVAEAHAAIRLKPDHPEAHANLGLVIRCRGEFGEAIAELQRARQLANSNPSLAQRIGRTLTATKQQAALATRLTANLAGKVRPADAAETLGFALLCYDKKLHGASARFWAEVFQAQPKLADDMQAQHRYNAASAAALAGCGQGKDNPPLDEPTKSRWRKQAIDWLKADLAHWTKEAESKKPEAKALVTKTLHH